MQWVQVHFIHLNGNAQYGNSDKDDISNNMDTNSNNANSFCIQMSLFIHKSNVRVYQGHKFQKRSSKSSQSVG